MATIENQKPHALNLSNREKCSLTGVKEIIVSDDEYIELFTYFDKLFLKGSGLKIQSFDAVSGKLELVGRIDSLSYRGRKSSSRKAFPKLGVEKYVEKR